MMKFAVAGQDLNLRFLRVGDNPQFIGLCRQGVNQG